MVADSADRPIQTDEHYPFFKQCKVQQKKQKTKIEQDILPHQHASIRISGVVPNSHSDGPRILSETAFKIVFAVFFAL